MILAFIAEFRSPTVNPARAGMIRGYSKTGHGDAGKPRASGDDPCVLVLGVAGLA